MGDCVLTTPAIELLHAARPDLQIGVVVEEAYDGVFEGNPAIAAIMEPESQVLRSWRPALALNLHGGTRSMMLTYSSGARFKAGFGHHRGSSIIYTVRIPRAQKIFEDERAVHTAEHLASAMFYLGVPISKVPRARLFADKNPPRRPYAVIHPTAAAEYKTWPIGRFREVAEHIQRVHGLEPVFIGGETDDLSEFHSYRRMVGAAISSVKALLSDAALFVGNDSGPAHMAAALNLPVAVIYGRVEHTTTWAPWKAKDARAFCSALGIESVETADVIQGIDELMRAPAKTR